MVIAHWMGSIITDTCGFIGSRVWIHTKDMPDGIFIPVETSEIVVEVEK